MQQTLNKNWTPSYQGFVSMCVSLCLLTCESLLCLPSFPWGVNIIPCNLFLTRSLFLYLVFRTVATFSTEQLPHLPPSDCSLFGFLNWSFWRILFIAAPGKWLHTIVILLYCYLAYIISWRFSLIEINCSHSFHYRNYFLLSFSLP